MSENLFQFGPNSLGNLSSTVAGAYRAMIHEPPVQPVAQAASLQQLFSAHQQLLDGLARLETETAKSVPDKAAVRAARLALSQASRKRSTILDSVLASEARIRTGPDLLQLVALQDSVRRARTASTAHVARWSQSALEADWAWLLPRLGPDATAHA